MKFHVLAVPPGSQTSDDSFSPGFAHAASALLGPMVSLARYQSLLIRYFLNIATLQSPSRVLLFLLEAVRLMTSAIWGPFPFLPQALFLG